MEMYTCEACGEKLPLASYYSALTKLGHTKSCKPCLVEYNKTKRKERESFYIDKEKQVAIPISLRRAIDKYKDNDFFRAWIKAYLG